MKKTIFLSAFFMMLAAVPAAAQGWQYDAVLYGWISGLDGTIGLGRAVDEPLEASFSDLAGYLDFAAAGHFEAHNPKMVLLTDIYYVNLGAERDAEIGRQTVKVNMDFRQWILEFGGGYRVSEQFDLLLVGRYYIFDIGTTTSGISGQETNEKNRSWGDVFVVGRYHKGFGQKWLFSLRGDVGLGGSSFAWFGNAGLGYKFSDLFTLGLGYRILSLDYETGAGVDYFKYDMTTNGLGLALGFSFKKKIVFGC